MNSDQPLRHTLPEMGNTQFGDTFQRYQQQISRPNPGCIIFLCDQSKSMLDGIAGSARPKSESLATAINRFIKDLTMECLKGETKPRHYFDVAVIGYCTDEEGKPIVGPAFQGALTGRELVSVVDLYDNPLRTVMKEVDDGDGGTITKRTYVWYDPLARGGTPMMQGLYHCYQIANQWISAHQDSFPPIVIHFTDGEATDGDPEPAAETLRSLATNDGGVLLFNCHLSDKDVPGVLFPSSEYELPDEYALTLFRMSSLLPEKCLSTARAKGFTVQPGVRGMVLNADSTTLIQLIQIGTTIKRELR